VRSYLKWINGGINVLFKGKNSTGDYRVYWNPVYQEDGMV